MHARAQRAERITEAELVCGRRGSGRHGAAAMRFWYLPIIWLLLALGSPTSAPAASTPALCPQAFGSFSVGHWPPGCWRPYGPNSPFNREIPADPSVAPDSSAIVGHFLRYHIHFQGGPGRFALTTPGRAPVYWSQPSDPVVAIECTAKWGPGTCRGTNGVSINGISIRIPAGARPETFVEGHMTVVDQAAQREYDFYHAAWAPDHRKLSVWSGGEVPIGPDSGTGLGPPTTAANFSNMAGLIRGAELQAGYINHALVASVPCTSGFSWPARGAYGYSCRDLGQPDPAGGAAPKLGMLLQLKMTDRQIAASGAPRWEQAVMTAMARYGIYVNDTNGSGDPNSIELEALGDESFTTFGATPDLASSLWRLGGSYYAPLDRWILSGTTIRAADLRVIAPCVPRGTCGTAARRATARQLRSHHTRARRKHRPSRHRA